MSPPREAVLACIAQGGQEGWLRPLDEALVRFLDESTPGLPPAVLAAAALLSQAEGQGHPCLDLDALQADAGATLQLPPAAAPLLQALTDDGAALASPALRGLIADGADAPAAGRGADEASPPTPLLRDGPRLYLRRYAEMERRVAAGLRLRLAAPSPVAGTSAAGRWLDCLFGPATPGEPDAQRLACERATRHALTVITGGPGTGKTTTATRLLLLLELLHGAAGAHADTGPSARALRIGLAAPTGKAAARLRESLAAGLAHLRASITPQVPPDEQAAWTAALDRLGSALDGARTLHALLGARPGSRGFRHDAERPLALDLLLVDEASMVHLELMDALLAALRPSAALVLLGDRDQLASVEAGSVLGEWCAAAAAGAAATAAVVPSTGAAAPTASAASNEPAAAPAASATSAAPAASDEPAAVPAASATSNARPAAPPADATGQLSLALDFGEAEPAQGRDEARPNARQAASGDRRHAAPDDLWSQQTVHLTRSHRFQGPIARLAQAVREGDAAAAQAALAAGPPQELAWRLLAAADAGDTGAAAAAAPPAQRLSAGYAPYARALRERPEDPAAFETWAAQALDAFARYRVLAVQREGPWGVAGLNAQIAAQVLGSRLDGRAADAWVEGRPVMVTRNDAALGLANGDIGLVLRRPADRRWVAVFARGTGLASVSVSRLPPVETAFAMTVHKSQGSEFDAVHLVLPPAGSPLLTRELLYTGITRARRALVLAGPDPAAIAQALGRATRRYSGLAVLLRR